MDDEMELSAIAILCITLIEAIAIIKGIDGTALAAAML